ncbi:M60 family metallopeptidase [Niabella beijingensis]|uniref:M60 family metallopeptidase n=1 Tax=Niabella beijingensis TaxID=2872700 RepID=UPI001CBDAEFB|nr:M60 family metallopeptidase [Niabella beijingensis]MBZ4189074.1 M60 family metallopeptidase [Niabella beijingensis]
MNRRLRYNLLVTGLIMTAFFSCKRNYDFGYKDGFPDSGKDGASVTVDTSIKKIDVSRYAKARVFPGLVCTDETRLMNYTVNMNLKYFPADKEQLRMSTIPEPQFSTGVYAAPGELVIIDVPAGVGSLSYQIGAWTYDASAVQNSQRDPVIFTTNSLAPGRNYLRNPYGGPVYIIANTSFDAPVPITFSNVVKMPDFILGQTNEAEWKAAIRSSCVPWLELRSNNLIFTVPREFCVTRNISNLDALMKQWDDAINFDYYQWIGLKAVTSGEDAVDQAPLLPWRAVLDITMPPGAGGVSGYPFRAQYGYGWFDEWTDPEYINNAASWGTFHELGHNHQQGQYWSWSSLGETTNNLFIFKNASRLGVYPAKHTFPVDDLLPKINDALAFAASTSTTKNFDGSDPLISDPFKRLTPFLQIFDKVPANYGYPGQEDGWGFMTALYKKARRAARISTTDQQKRDFVYETLCEYTRQDWKEFFKAWGITISNISLAKMAQYPVMRQKIWEYNPISRTGGDGFFYAPLVRTGWTITANSEEAVGEGGTNGKVATLLDGDLTTFWHSQWYDGTAEPPYVITVDMKSVQSIIGIQIAQRQSGSGTSRPVKHIRVEVSSDGSSWTETGSSPFTLQNIQGLQNLFFPNYVSARYFRITIPSMADNYGGDEFSALSELNGLK